MGRLFCFHCILMAAAAPSFCSKFYGMAAAVLDYIWARCTCTEVETSCTSSFCSEFALHFHLGKLNVCFGGSSAQRWSTPPSMQYNQSRCNSSQFLIFNRELDRKYRIPAARRCIMLSGGITCGSDGASTPSLMYFMLLNM